MQVVGSGLVAIKAFGLNAKEKITGNPTGWTITWNAVKGDKARGYWLALPQSADRQIAFRSVVSKANPKDRARKRVMEMIHESRNGQKMCKPASN